MLKKMLKAANLKSEKELLKKYPNEIDFLREHGDKLFQFDEGGEACYDDKGNVIPCEQKYGSDAYSAMQPFYDTMFQAANKYANSETGMVSPFNSLRAKAKALVKHPEVLFMKRHDINDESADPYKTGQYTVDRLGNRTTTWWPNQWAEPRQERNTGGGWQNFKMKLRERGEERRGRRNRNSTGCWGANCTEAEMQDQAMYGGTFQEGGAPQEMMMQQGPPMEQQGAAPQEGGGQDQAMQQVVQFIMQALQQQMPQEQIIAQIIEMTGMGEEEAMQILQLVVEKMSGAEQAPQEGGMMPPQGPEQEMMQQGPPPPGMKMGGMYKKGGSYSGTYDAGTGGYYAQGGSYVPMYSEYAYGGNYPMYRGGGEPCPGEGQIRNEQGTCVCGPEYDTDPDTGQCIRKQTTNTTTAAPSENEEGPSMMPPTFGGQSSMPPSRGGFNAGFGLQGKNYNFDYGFGVGADMKSDVNHNVNFNIPKAFRMGVNSGDIGLTGRYVPGKSWSGNLNAGVPLSGAKGRTDLLRFTGGMGQNFTAPPSNGGMMTSGSKGTPLNYNAGVEYLGRMFGEKGPNVKLRASYNRENQYGGPTTRQYKKGGEYNMSEKEIQDLIKKGYKIQYL